jgi:hypothetical protein
MLANQMESVQCLRPLLGRPPANCLVVLCMLALAMAVSVVVWLLALAQHPAHPLESFLLLAAVGLPVAKHRLWAVWVLKVALSALPQAHPSVQAALCL